MVCDIISADPGGSVSNRHHNIDSPNIWCKYDMEFIDQNYIADIFQYQGQWK